MYKTQLKALSVAAVLGLASQAVQAAPVYWTDWLLSTGPFATGTIDLGNGQNLAASLLSSTPLSANTQVNGGGTNYWNYSPSTYTSATTDNAPGNTDIIGFNAGGTVTVVFSESVHDPILALLSWNGNHVQFEPGTQINYLSSGNGYYGTGTFTNTTANSFDASGDLNGVIQLIGDYTSFTFTHTTENWHGFTLGILGLTPPPPNEVPEPAALALLGLGAVGLLATRRRKVKTSGQ
jgi:hypothetical protein